MPPSDPTYVYDPSVTDDLDWELRVLLASCFPGPMFRTKRYNAELPAHRWLIRDDDGRLAAHLALHDKWIRVNGSFLRVGGVAEVCVHPAHRRQGHAGRLLQTAHSWMRAEGITHSILFGRVEIYGSKGYRRVEAPCRRFETGTWTDTPCEHFLACPLAGLPWPDGPVDLRGPAF